MAIGPKEVCEFQKKLQLIEAAINSYLLAHADFLNVDSIKRFLEVPLEFDMTHDEVGAICTKYKEAGWLSVRAIPQPTSSPIKWRMIFSAKEE